MSDKETVENQNPYQAAEDCGSKDGREQRSNEWLMFTLEVYGIGLLSSLPFFLVRESPFLDLIDRFGWYAAPATIGLSVGLLTAVWFGVTWFFKLLAVLLGLNLGSGEDRRQSEFRSLVTDFLRSASVFLLGFASSQGAAAVIDIWM